MDKLVNLELKREAFMDNGEVGSGELIRNNARHSRKLNKEFDLDQVGRKGYDVKQETKTQSDFYNKPVYPETPVMLR